MEQFTMVIYGEDLEIDKMQWRELDVRLILKKELDDH